MTTNATSPSASASTSTFRSSCAPGPPTDNLADVVSYDTMIASVREIVNAGHVNLVETLAERIAERCLIDRRVKIAKVRVEKLDVFPEAASIGVEIERKQV